MKVQESFQQTLQGEGSHAGTPCDFIRLYGCPVQCAFCDTGYSYNATALPDFEERTIQQLTKELKSSLVVISGGEPFIHKDLNALVQAVLGTGRSCHIETSGAAALPMIERKAWITLSPKHHVNSAWPVQVSVASRANEIKLVVSDGTELAFYSDLLRHAEGNDIPVFLQPEWEQREDTLPLVLDLLIQNPNYRLSLQTHKYIGIE